MLRTLIALSMIALTTGGASLALRAAFPLAWSRWLRRAVIVAASATVLGFAVWRIGRALELDVLWRIGAAVTAVFFVSVTALFLTSPLYAVPGILLRRGQATDPSRRAFLRNALGAVPASAAAVGPGGAVAASLHPVLRRVEVRSAHVPAALDGLKILQLTDVHLGAFIDVAQVRAAVEVTRPEAPDLVVLTGDIVDDFSLLPDALSAVRQLAPPLGVFACIGNHEIYRGRAEAERLLAEGGVRFLCNDGVVLERGGARLWLCGADDPARLGQEHRPFLEKTIARALAGCPSDVTCRVVLCHRPEGFEAAARHGATLTLSGHTHGAQMALFGRSLFEWALPESYLLGTYRRGESVLYTSAGLGHWFPFRLNCPCEVALITLRAAAPSTRA